MTKEITNFSLLENHLIVLAENQDEAILRNDKEDSQRLWQDQINAIQSFLLSAIETALKKQKAEILGKIEKKKKEHLPTCRAIKDGYGYKFRDCNSNCQANGYNQALQDILKLLGEEI